MMIDLGRARLAGSAAVKGTDFFLALARRVSPLARRDYSLGPLRFFRMREVHSVSPSPASSARFRLSS